MKLLYMRDLRKPLELSNEDLQNRVNRFEVITDTKFNDVFADTVNNFIGILREKHRIEKSIPNNKKIKRELEALMKALTRASHIQNNQLSQHVEMCLFGALEDRMSTFYECGQHIETLTHGCATAIENLDRKTKSKEFSFTAVKQAMATELARELASFGVDITAYRDGVFEKCVRELFSAINGETNNRTFNTYVPEDLFQVIKTAKENYQNSEPFALLKIR